MAAIDNSSEVRLHRYKNKEWSIETHSFPASMSTHQEIREYFGFTNPLSDTRISFIPYIDVYCGEYNKETNSRPYAVSLNLFKVHSQLIFCDTFIDLMNLLNEVNGYTNNIKTATSPVYGSTSGYNTHSSSYGYVGTGYKNCSAVGTVNKNLNAMGGSHGIKSIFKKIGTWYKNYQQNFGGSRVG